jgi:hypothetical protein
MLRALFPGTIALHSIRVLANQASSEMQLRHGANIVSNTMLAVLTPDFQPGPRFKMINFPWWSKEDVSMQTSDSKDIGTKYDKIASWWNSNVAFSKRGVKEIDLI